MDIRWSIGVSYVDLDEMRLFASYVVNAKNKSTAENIGRELFLMEFGVVNELDIFVEPVRLTSDDLARIYRVKDTMFSKIALEFQSKTYKEFTLAFQQFDGFSSYLSSMDNSYFWFEFMGLTAKAVFTLDGDCYIDTKEVYYKRNNGNKIVARNNWSEFYYCAG